MHACAVVILHIVHIMFEKNVIQEVLFLSPAGGDWVLSSDFFAYLTLFSHESFKILDCFADCQGKAYLNGVAVFYYNILQQE